MTISNPKITQNRTKIVVSFIITTLRSFKNDKEISNFRPIIDSPR